MKLFQIDDELFVKKLVDRTVADALMAKLKLLTGTKLNEIRLPQDNRVCLKIYEEIFALRASILSNVFEKNIVFIIFNIDIRIG